MTNGRMRIPARLMRRGALMERSIGIAWKYECGLIESFLKDHTEWRGSPDVMYVYDRKLHDYVVDFHRSAVNSLMGWLQLSATGLHVLMQDYAFQLSGLVATGRLSCRS